MFGLFNRNSRGQSVRLHPANAGPTEADYRLSGFTAGTRIATAAGWRVVETITVGEEVLTFDNGPQSVVATTRGAHLAAGDALPAFAAPVDVPIRAIGNEDPMVLLPEQAVLIESDAAEAIFGDPFALVAAKALAGFRGIERFRSLRPVEVVTLHCENDELLFANGGGLMLAPSNVPGTVTLDLLDAGGAPAPYRTLRGPQADRLMTAMVKEDAHSFRMVDSAVA